MKAPIQSSPDNRLFEALKNGEKTAFEKIYFVHADFLFAYAMKRLNSNELAADLIQEVFYKFWAKKDSIQLKGELRAYLTLCLRNLIIDHYSHELVKNKYHNLSGALLQDVDNSTSELLDYNDTHQTLQIAINGLPAKMQRVFHLSKIKEYSIDEISNELKLSQQTVKNQLGTAIKRLRVSLGVLSFIPVLFLFQK